MEKHMNQSDLADKLQIKQQQLSRYEKGLSFPSLAILYELEEILDCTLKELYSKTV
jgi:transcriptional regulator with XRE-family HTH domain